MSRVLLVTPTFHYADAYPSFLSFSDFPTGFGYLTSALKQAGHEVFGCNPNNIIGYPNAYMMIQDVISKRVNEVKPDLIGLGGLATDYAFLRDAIGVIRRVTKVPIVLGGQIVTNDAEDVYNLLKPDWAVVGEGEKAIVDIADCKFPPEMSPIWRSEPLPIDAIPFPDYEPFGIKNMIDNYSDFTRMLYRYSRTYPRPFGIVCARGCPFACTFCIDHHRGYRARSIGSIMDEISETYKKYHFNILILLDELFAVNKQRMIDFCERLLEARREYHWDFDWMFQTHANAHLDLESMKLMKDAGCVSFSYGLESASPTVLKSINKKLRPEQVSEAIELAEQAGLGFSTNLIFGDPAETRKTIGESLEFWLKYGQKQNIFLAIMKPYPGSSIFGECLKRGLIKDKKKYYENIDKQFINMTTIPDYEFKEFHKLFGFLEQNWLFVEHAINVRKTIAPLGDSILEKLAGGRFVHIKATCPYCGEETEYREHRADPEAPFFLGVSCIKCWCKIKVLVD